jgi:hypothetical protein
VTPVIPPPDVELDVLEQRRWEFTKAAYGLIQAGVPAALVMVDAREGCDLATGQTRPARRVR